MQDGLLGVFGNTNNQLFVVLYENGPRMHKPAVCGHLLWCTMSSAAEYRREYKEFSSRLDTILNKIDHRVSINEDLNSLLPKRAYDSEAQRNHYLALREVWSHYESVGTQLVDLIGPIHPNFWKWADIRAVRLDLDARIDDIESLLDRDETTQHRLTTLFPPDGTIVNPAVHLRLEEHAWWLARHLGSGDLRHLIQLTEAQVRDEFNSARHPILDLWKFWKEEIHPDEKVAFALRFMRAGAKFPSHLAWKFWRDRVDDSDMGEFALRLMESGIEPTVDAMWVIDLPSRLPEILEGMQPARDFLDQTWTLQRHRNFPRATSPILLTVLLCAKRMEPALPKEIWLIIFEFLTRRDFVINMRN